MAVKSRPVVELLLENASTVCEQLRVGDLIFRHGTKKGVDATFVRFFQRNVGSYPEVAANITHVAMYIGDGKIIHAVPPAVCEDRLERYFSGSKISLVSWEVVSGDRSALADRIVQHMQRNIGVPYPKVALIRQCLKETAEHHRLSPKLGNDRKDQLAICSWVVFDSFDYVLDEQNPLYSETVPRKTKILLPAHLFMQPGLIDIKRP